MCTHTESYIHHTCSRVHQIVLYMYTHSYNIKATCTVIHKYYYIFQNIKKYGHHPINSILIFFLTNYKIWIYDHTVNFLIIWFTWFTECCSHTTVSVFTYMHYVPRPTLYIPPSLHSWFNTCTRICPQLKLKFTCEFNHSHVRLLWDSLNCHGFVFFPTLAPTVALPGSTLRFPSALHSTAAV